MTEEQMVELQAENAKLKQKINELNDEIDFLKTFDKIYSTAIALTTNTVTFVDIAKRSLNQIVNEGDYFGIASSMENAPESIIETGIIYPDDCEEYRRFYREIYAGKPTMEATMRVLEGNRGWVWFTMYGKTIYNEDGTPERTVVFSDDITARKRVEQQYDEYRKMVTNGADFVWEANLTKDAMITESDMTKHFFEDDNFQKYSVLQERAFSKVHKDFVDIVQDTFSLEGMINAYNNAKREVVLEYPFYVPNGEVLWLNSTAYLLTNYEGEICAIVCSKDITEKKKNENELRKMAQRDPLSGLYNRRTFEDKVRVCINTDSDKKSQLLIIDVDDFKQINDRFGHTFGDTVIKTIADVLVEQFRPYGYVARIGGDEFMVYLHEYLDKSLMQEKLDCIRKNLSNLDTGLGKSVNISLSIGSVIHRDGEVFEDMYKNADEALYKAKQGGKDIIVAFEDLA